MRLSFAAPMAAAQHFDPNSDYTFVGGHQVPKRRLATGSEQTDIDRAAFARAVANDVQRTSGRDIDTHIPSNFLPPEQRRTWTAPAGVSEILKPLALPHGGSHRFVDPGITFSQLPSSLPRDSTGSIDWSRVAVEQGDE